MPTEVSKIEEIIKSELEEETKKSIDQLVALMTSETQHAVDRINGVYNSAISTLKKLELTDATIFDFFQKAKGNIRVVEFENRYWEELRVDTDRGDNPMGGQPRINLKEKTKYKIIVMAIEQPAEKKE